jgi:hypothetical protein
MAAGWNTVKVFGRRLSIRASESGRRWYGALRVEAAVLETFACDEDEVSRQGRVQSCADRTEDLILPSGMFICIKL